jgi:hypothetical protein
MAPRNIGETTRETDGGIFDRARKRPSRFEEKQTLWVVVSIRVSESGDARGDVDLRGRSSLEGQE